MSSRGGTVGRLEKDFSIVKLTSSMRRVEQKRQVSLLSMDLVRKWNRSAKRNRPIPDFMTTPRQSRLFSFDNPRKTHYIFQWPSKLKDSIALSSGAVSPKGRDKESFLEMLSQAEMPPANPCLPEYVQMQRIGTWPLSSHNEAFAETSLVPYSIETNSLQQPTMRRDASCCTPLAISYEAARLALEL